VWTLINPCSTSALLLTCDLLAIAKFLVLNIQKIRTIVMSVCVLQSAVLAEWGIHVYSQESYCICIISGRNIYYF